MMLRYYAQLSYDPYGTSRNLSSKWVTEVNILRANFTIQANGPLQNYFSRQLIPKAL